VCVHEGRWRIDLDPATGQVHVTRPDGTPYEIGPSHPWTTPTCAVRRCLIRAEVRDLCR
jgi:hypothetical protein